MEILYTLIPLSIVVVFGILVALAWAAHSGQFEDLDVEAERILLDDFAPPPGNETVPGETAASEAPQDPASPASNDTTATSTADTRAKQTRA